MSSGGDALNFRWIGAILIIGSSSSFGMSIVIKHKHDEVMLKNLIEILDDMLRELPFQLTPLPELVRHAAENHHGMIRKIFQSLSDHLNRQVLPDAASCMVAAIHDSQLPDSMIRSQLLVIGQSLGRFDLSGQLNGLTAAREQCIHTLHLLQASRNDSLRCCRTVSICAGIALAILLI